MSPDTPFRHERALRLGLVAAAILGGIAFRFWHIFSEPLWLDEAYSAWAADHGLRFLWRVVPSYETHPPFYYTLLHVWQAVSGTSLIARRLPGLIAGLAFLPVAASLAGRLSAAAGLARNDTLWLAAGAVALAALGPVMIEMSREVRPYPLMILAYAGAIGALLRIAARRQEGRALGGAPLVWFFVAEALLAWLHNLGGLYVAALSLALLIVAAPFSRRDWAWLVGGHVAVALVWLPAFLILLDQAPTWVRSTWLRFEWAHFDERLAILYATPGSAPATAALILAAGGGWLLWRHDGRPRLALALAATAAGPVLLSLALTLAVAPVFLTRTLAPCVVPAILLMARGLAMPGRARLAGPALALSLLLAMVDSDIRWRARGAMQDWYGAVTWLAARHRPGDVVWAYPNEGALPFAYAARDRRLPLPVRAIPAPVPAVGIGYYPTGSRGAVSLHPAEIARFVAGPEARTAPTLWLLRLGPNAYDPGDAMLRALLKRRVMVARWRAGPIDLVGLRLRLPSLSGEGLGVGRLSLTERQAQVERPHPNPSPEGEGSRPRPAAPADAAAAR